jgi:hypothetical protein
LAASLFILYLLERELGASVADSVFPKEYEYFCSPEKFDDDDLIGLLPLNSRIREAAG